MNPLEKNHQHNTRRQFFSRTATGIGAAALGSLLSNDLQACSTDSTAGLPTANHPATAKRVIYLMMSGGPSHVDLFDHKPEILPRRGEPLPDSVRQGQRLTTMTSGQKKFLVLPPLKPFRPRGKSRMMLSDLIPYTGEIADDICLIKSMTVSYTHLTLPTIYSV